MGCPRGTVPVIYGIVSSIFSWQEIDDAYFDENIKIVWVTFYWSIIIEGIRNAMAEFPNEIMD